MYDFISKTSMLPQTNIATLRTNTEKKISHVHHDDLLESCEPICGGFARGKPGR